MLKTRIKVCCIASREEARMAWSVGADALGLVGQMPSGPGVLDDETIADIAARVPPPVSRFLLTSETRVDAIIAHGRRCRTDTIQLVDSVAPADYAAIRAALPGVRLVQVIHVEGPAQVAEAKRYDLAADALLLDSGRPSTGELGGTGRTHDWAVSKVIVDGVHSPVFLAGGLNVGNVGAAIHQVRPYGVDVCSGVRAEGKLDANKLRAFVDAVHRATCVA